MSGCVEQRDIPMGCGEVSGGNINGYTADRVSVGRMSTGQDLPISLISQSV